MNLQNLIDYCKAYDLPDPLSGISVPEPIDADRVRAAIMMRCGLLEPVYPQPDVFRQTLAQWFDNRAWNFEHLIKIIRAEYSPIENTDKYSDHSISRDGNETIRQGGSDIIMDGGKDTVQLSGSDETALSGTDTLQLSGSDTTSASGTDTTTETPNTTTTRTDEISAENANTYQPDNKQTTTETGTTETETDYGKTDTTTYGKKDTTTYGKKDTLTYGKKDETTYGKTSETAYGKTEERRTDGDESYTEHTHGNIGVTTNQQMITEELELIKRFNLYDWIAERVEADLFVMVY